MTEGQLSTIWKDVLLDLEKSFSITIYKTWFKQTSLNQLKPGFAEVAVENALSPNFIKKYAEDRIIKALSKESGLVISTVSYITKKRGKGKKQNIPTGPDLFDSTQVPVIEQSISKPQSRPINDIPSNLNPKYNFENFIVGNRNRLAHAAARAVAEKPGKLYNPLYLYGGVGLGKTHLMQAIGNQIVAHEPQRKVVYVSCENFTNEYVAGIRSNKMDVFKKKYRNVDVFLIDDIQFIGGKDGIQEEFFHTFNTLYQADKQIIITSDKVPSDIADLEDRLSSRFSSGMIADMQLPDLETRQAILQAKCEENGIPLSSEILYSIADMVESNIRELEGALSTVFLHIDANDRTPTSPELREILKAFSANKPLKKTSLEQIKEVVCEYYGVDFKDIAGPRRQQEIVKPRQVLIYLLKHELSLTYPTIGREIGGRDHTTAMHSVEKIEKEIKKNPEMFEEIQRLKELFYSTAR